MKSGGTVNYAAKIKEEHDDMCYNENDDGVLEDQTSETENLRYLRCLQENITVHTLEEQRKINGFQPNQEIKIEFECKDVKPNWNSLVHYNVSDWSEQYQDVKMSDNFATHSSIKVETESIEGKEFLSDIMKTRDLITYCKLNEQNMKIYPLVNEDKQSFECKTCLKKLFSKRTLQAHIDSEHNRINHPCHTCEKTFIRKSNLKIHIDSVHNGQKPHICDICEQAFTKKSSLKTHIDSVHNRINYLCHTCGKTFSYKHILKLHIDSVHNHITHQCEICGKSFAQKHKIKAHINSMHNGLKPYFCDTCGKSYACTGDLKQHIDSMHNRIKYPCLTCGKTFLHKSSLKVHIDSVHNYISYPCHICGKRFSYKVSVKVHIDSVHNGRKTLQL